MSPRRSARSRVLAGSLLVAAWLMTWQTLGVLTWLGAFSVDSDDSLAVMLVGWPLYYTILGFIGLSVGVLVCLVFITRVPPSWPTARRRWAVLGLGAVAALPATLQFLVSFGAAVVPITLLYAGLTACLFWLFRVDQAFSDMAGSPKVRR